MAYTPMNHHLISHEDAVALELEASISEYLVRQLWSKDFLALDDHSVFRREYMGQFEADLSSVHMKNLLCENMLRAHPTTPIRIETSEISQRYFEEYFKKEDPRVRRMPPRTDT
jgi:hypothetical protein